MPKILVVGSLSFDLIFEVHGNIKHEIPLRNGEIDNVNLMFTAKEKKQFFGGTAGNIAYGLGILGEHPLLFSLAGKDFDDDFKPHLEKNGVHTKVIEKMEEFTATFYGISDEAKQQIGIWQPNAYGNWIDKANLSETLSENEISGVEIAIFSPGTGISTKNSMKELRERNKKATVIFDPSQVLSIFYDKDLLLECLRYSDIFIGNETEIAQLNTLFGLDVKAILDLGIKAVIETKGENGVDVHEGINLTDSKKDNIITTHIDPVKPNRFVEATGAGDAFRSGFIYGLANGKSIKDSSKIGTYTGAKSVEEFGGQLYNVSLQELKDLKFI